MTVPARPVVNQGSTLWVTYSAPLSTDVKSAVVEGVRFFPTVFARAQERGNTSLWDFSRSRCLGAPPNLPPT
jgi:hypothetical protein